ncbi:MAG: hypothetical protein HZA53_01840 [Planctomycetes bacterium]|nr:hypothetical protein [Planctomycetota bacterium]
MSVLLASICLLGLLAVATRNSVVEVRDARRGLEDVRAQFVAEAGLERAMAFLTQAVDNTSVSDPLGGLSTLFAGSTTLTPFVGEPLMDGTRRVGAYSIALTRVDNTPASISIAITATGYLPDAPSALPAGRSPEAWCALRRTVRYEIAPSQVFDYSYFINNWGWFYGDTIHGNGNVRSNGQFDGGGYAASITGQPLYDQVAWSGSAATLSGYRDDNADGLSNGLDGGTFSSWDIVNAQNMNGQGVQASNQHDFQPTVPMPNLTDLGQYESAAVAAGASITVGGVTVVNGVLGDDAGEKQNLYLVGTDASPIVISGAVVVRGNVILSGVVTGQGAVYSGGNVYCPKSVTYKNAPAAPRPTDNTQAATEAWLTSNWNKDFLGLFARENIVVGDYTHAWWQYYVGLWMGDALNQSAEDAGADGMPNTRNGRDGILGTADDDVLEGDGVFTIEHYTEADAAAGSIPAGKSVGDPIPGPGEDIDGDGVYDASTSLSNVNLTVPLNTANWAGNMPAAGISSYGSIASLYANRMDAVFYTNHSFCWLVLGSTPAKVNGALVSRNENIIYGTPSLEFNHDARLLGGASGKAAPWLPRELMPVRTLSWKKLDVDPNRYAGAP